MRFFNKILPTNSTTTTRRSDKDISEKITNKIQRNWNNEKNLPDIQNIVAMDN